jgi:hypothetical protein
MLYDRQCHGNSAVAFVYCDHDTRELQTTRNLMGALLGQLIVHFPAEHQIVRDLLVRQENDRPLDLHTVLSFLERIITTGLFSRIQLCADGLDELIPSHHRSFLNALASLHKFSTVSFLFFGRDNAGVWAQVKSSFHGTVAADTNYKIIGDMTVGDRRLFLRRRLEEDKEGRGFTDELRDLIFEHLAPSDSTCV